MKFLKRQPPGRLIALGFLLTILLGSVLLSLPVSVKEGRSIPYIDSLYTSTSAVCVTGLIAVDAGDNFTLFGQAVLAVLIQIGGLGVTSIGAGIIIAMGKRVNLKGRSLIREALNLDTGKGIITLVKSVFFTTVTFQLIGAALSFFSFSKVFPTGKALWVSLFHSIAAFNNAGFDILGGGANLIPYQDDLLLNLTTCALVIFGGIGFLVIREVLTKKFRWKRLSMHSRVVLTTSAALLLIGAVLLKLTDRLPWMGAFFFSTSARTAGFSTYSLGSFSNAGLLVVMILMFIGASPGSTGGGVKTSTLFALLQGVKSAATNKSEKAFHYSLPAEAFRKAAVITLMGVGIVLTGTILLCALEPDVPLRDAIFEMTSAFGTVGLSTGITPGLGVGSKLLSILIMYIGRLGPMTIATLWYFDKGERISYPEGNISIG